MALLRNSDLFNATSRIPVTDSNQVTKDAQGGDAFTVDDNDRPPSPNRPIEGDLPDDVDDGAPDNYYVDDVDHDDDDGGGAFDMEPHGEQDHMEGERPGTNSMDLNEYTTGAFIGDNLLPMPNIINKVDLRIDTRRKIINMKLLKRLVWKILNFEHGGTEMKFGDLYRRLLKEIPANMQQDVTAPVTFFTVLILVNEKSLNMTGESTEEVTIHKSVAAPAQAQQGPSTLLTPK
ncbi:hypothetical protein WDU94_001961 [Cyamophila willieti]